MPRIAMAPALIIGLAVATFTSLAACGGSVSGEPGAAGWADATHTAAQVHPFSALAGDAPV